MKVSANKLNELYSINKKPFRREPKKVINSNKVISIVMDKHYSISSPSKKRLLSKEIQGKARENLKNQYEIKEKSENLKEITEKYEKIGTESKENPIIYSQDCLYSDSETGKISINLAFYGRSTHEKFTESLESALSLLISSNEYKTKSSIEEKTVVLLRNLKNKRRSIRLGCIVGLYLILRKYEISISLYNSIFNSILDALNEYQTQEELFLVACFEVLKLFILNNTDETSTISEFHQRIINSMTFFCMFLTDNSFPILQKSCLHLIFLIGYEGIAFLVKLATKDYLEYQDLILNFLLSTPHIQRHVIVKSLLNDLTSDSSLIRNSAMACLTRLYDALDSDEILLYLSEFLYKDKIDKPLLVSVIRSIGPIGERFLSNELIKGDDFQLKSIIISSLSSRLPKYKSYLSLVLDSNDSNSCIKRLPGNFISYEGKVSPIFQMINTMDDLNKGENLFIYEKDKEDNTYKYRELVDGISIEKEVMTANVSSRDFISSLNRMIKHDNQYKSLHSHPKLVYFGEINLLDELDSYLLGRIKSKANPIEDSELDFYLLNYKDDYEFINEKYEVYLQKETIKSIASCLKDYFPIVRDFSAFAIGKIGLPEGEIVINDVISLLINEKDSNVKGRLLWTLGRLSEVCEERVLEILNDSLKSLLWKVKLNSLYAISQFGSRASRLCLPSLTRLIKESPINKTIIAETMIRIGAEGERVLLSLVNSRSEERNYKLISSILTSFLLVNLTSSNIDNIIETCFYFSNSENEVVKKNSLLLIETMFNMNKDSEEVTFLRKKNVIPLFYQMLSEKSKEIQNVSIYYLYITFILPFILDLYWIY